MSIFPQVTTHVAPWRSRLPDRGLGVDADLAKEAGCADFASVRAPIPSHGTDYQTHNLRKFFNNFAYLNERRQ
ncbi:hypothetical protein [Gallaecimonas mangrovi]|uniref:hypothetical protein n=1 Tax=Gallaecimonas mangrovi TaxID=2291597 RepID=UPI0012603733|nr:hypothetical protein [Gallaecimonas mangrovi]